MGDDFSAAHNKSGAGCRSRALYPFFKTVMCKNYPNCKYGDRCNFAHGPDELRRGERSAQRHEQTSPRKDDGKRAYSMACVRLNAGETTRQGWIWGDLVLSTVRLG